MAIILSKKKSKFVFIFMFEYIQFLYYLTQTKYGFIVFFLISMSTYISKLLYEGENKR